MAGSTSRWCSRLWGVDITDVAVVFGGGGEQCAYHLVNTGSVPGLVVI